MIGEVFRGADTVRVWVGEHDGGSEMLFRGWPKEQKTHANIASSLVKELDRVLLRRSQLTRDESKRRADVWMRFFNRSYWGRTWICQEIYQARIIVVHCGEDEMGWGQLIASRFESESCFDGISLRAALNVPESAQLGYNVIGKIRELNVNRRGASGSAVIGSFHDKDVLFFTQHFSHSWATIPHDKVWAFVSMEGSKYEDDPLSVSYEISLPDLLLSLYEQRLVLWDEKLGFTKWRRRLPDLDLVIESLRLGQDQRLEVLRRLVDRVTKTTEEPYRQRWEHLLTRQEFANDRIWRRDRKVNGSGNVKYTRDWQWENSSWAPMPTQREKLPRDLDDNAPAPVRSSRTARIVRLRFNGDQYYVRMPLPFNRRSTGG